MGTRRSVAGILLLAGSVLALGCGDSRLRKLTVGISKDSAMTVMGGKPERIDAYIVNSRLIEAMLYARPGVDSGQTPERDLSPVVLESGQVTAWGWGKWEAIAKEHNIQLKP